MKIGFDCDGTIVDGKYLTQPERASHAYNQLDPYDKDTREIWNQIVQKHRDIYIISSRSYEGAVDDIFEWLSDEGMESPAGVICGISQDQKHSLVKVMDLSSFFDDSPKVFERGTYECPRTVFYLMNNPDWELNQKWYAGAARLNSWKQIGTILLA